MFKSEFIEINPFDLEPMVINENHVAELTELIKAAGGILEPVAVWMNADGKIHVINGFHRSECARRLGYTTIKAVLIDCNESAFWDLRITATTEHRSIANDRLHQWMLDAWSLTEWAGAEKASFARTAYSVYDYFYNRLNQPNLLNKQEKAVMEWFTDRAKIWGKSARDIAKIILDKSGLLIQYNNLLDIAVKEGLTYSDYVKAVQALEDDVVARSKGVDNKDIRDFITTNLGANGDGEWDTITEIKQQRAAEAEEKKRESLVQSVMDRVVRLKSSLSTVDDILASGVDLPALKRSYPIIDDQIAKTIEQMNLFVEWVSGDYKWNITTLREENAKLKQELADLRKKADRGPVIVPASTLAQSSSDYRY